LVRGEDTGDGTPATALLAHRGSLHRVHPMNIMSNT
jgi:hypothetical protein